MAATTLALGTSSYALLEALDSDAGSKLNVRKSGSSTTIRGDANRIDDLGLTTTATSGDFTSLVDSEDWERVNSNTNITDEVTSNINIFGTLNNFQADLGNRNDTLNIFGDVRGSRIFLDNAEKIGVGYINDGNDLLSISGSIGRGLDADKLQDNLIYAGAKNDTIRIAGSIDDAFVILGDGHDSFTASSGKNVDIKGDAGNDFIQFKNSSENTSINSGLDADTIILSGLTSDNEKLESASLQGFFEDPGTYDEQDAYEKLNFSDQGKSAIEMGAGNDSLVLGTGAYTNASFNTGNDNDTISIATGSTFQNTYFQLGNSGSYPTPSNPSPSIGRDRFTSAQNNQFLSTTIASTNVSGDTLVFGSGTHLLSYQDVGSTIALGSGGDSIVFGSTSVINDSYINTGSGADTLVFGSNTNLGNTTIDLGNDLEVDRIYFNSNPLDLADFQIKGAGNNDILYIGTTAYTYQGSDFYSGTPTGDSSNSWRNFA